MAIVQFPNPKHASSEGIVAFGGDLEPESLILAYREGIFPWPISNLPLAWFCPPRRGILEWKRIHIPRSLAKAIKKSTFKITLDQAFSEVITECQTIARPQQEETWITPEMKLAYLQLHHLGHAHSVEVWDQEQLVGGLYGVDGGGIFSGESMFHKKPNASKLAVLYLMEHLHARGLDWLDIQMLTPHMEHLGARVISRDRFLEKIKKAQAKGRKLF